MYENCDCFKFDDVILSEILEVLSIQCPTASFFHTWGPFQSEKINDFWTVGKCSKVMCEISHRYKNRFHTFGRICLNSQRNSS